MQSESLLTHLEPPCLLIETAFVMTVRKSLVHNGLYHVLRQ